MKRRNKIAIDLFSKKYRKRIVKPKRGKGSFSRKKLKKT
jgi:stalled ribosome alternative rescue factor ArfA|tara:strand:- start:79 stop:195 length:117 start_codon:yes stop_codon:yes gene_type:complete